MNSYIIKLNLKTGRSFYYLFYGEIQIQGYNSLEEAREVQALIDSSELIEDNEKAD
jgi:hypothetical protein